MKLLPICLVISTLSCAHADSPKEYGSVRRHRNNNGKRKLSVWSSFLNLLHPPRPPHGGSSHSVKGSNGASTSSGGSGGSGGSSSRGDSTGSSGGSSNHSSQSTTSSSHSGSGSSRTSSNNSHQYSNDGLHYDDEFFTDGETSGGTRRGWGSDGTGTSAATGTRTGRMAWIFILGGIALIATVAAAVAHRTSKNNEIGASRVSGGANANKGRHQLFGSVKKRNRAFAKTMRKKLGWKEATGAEELA